MTITEINYENLKGRSEAVALKPLNLIYGRNFSGKTTIIDAIKLALLGFHPANDKTARGIFELSSGDRMLVSATLSDSERCERVWERSGGTIKNRIRLPRGWPEIPVVLLDANAYFGATDRGKAELLFNAAKIKSDLTPEIVARQTHEILVDTDLSDCDLLDYMKKNGTSVQRAVEAILFGVENERSATAASVRRYADTLQGLSALRDANPVALDEDAERNLKAKRIELQAAEQDLKAAERRSDARELEALPAEKEVLETEGRFGQQERLLENVTEAIELAETRWAKLLAHDDCPMCGTSGKTWKKDAVKNMDAEMTALKSERDGYQLKLAELRKILADRRPKAAAARKRIKAADAKEIEDAEDKVVGLRDEVDAFGERLRGYYEDRAARESLRQAREAHEKLEIKERRLKAAKAYLLSVKEKLASGLFVGITETARRFTEGIMPALSFNENELGYWRTKFNASNDEPAAFTRGDWVPHRTFSGTESAIAFAALQAALGATAPIRLVVMDELGRLDPQNKERLLKNVANAHRDNAIDQFIGVDTEPTRLEWFNLIER